MIEEERKKQWIHWTEVFVKESMQEAEGGHDWWHIHRVRNNALLILRSEPADELVVELGALLHDIADSKFHSGDESIGPKKAESFLLSIQCPVDIVNHVKKIVENISFKGGKEKQTFHSKELSILQDADRLDALGAIGIARAFNYGGFKNRALYDPNIPPDLKMDKEAYKISTAPTINHFYEKLLLLKDRMNTPTGKKLAKERHQFLELYLERFINEWNGHY